MHKKICNKYGKKNNPLEMPGIEPGAFHMQSERATTALHPLSTIKDKNSLNLCRNIKARDCLISIQFLNDKSVSLNCDRIRSTKLEIYTGSF